MMLEMIISFILGAVFIHLIHYYIHTDYNKKKTKQSQIIAPIGREKRQCTTTNQHSLPTVTFNQSTKRPVQVDKDTQCESGAHPLWLPNETTRKMRNDDELIRLSKLEDGGSQLTVQEIQRLIILGKVKMSFIEKLTGANAKAVAVRRNWLAQSTSSSVDLSTIDEIPYLNYDYFYVSQTCCENVIGYVPVPCGFAGPLEVNGEKYYVPMSTTEGCLIASTSRGCRAITLSGNGVLADCEQDQMTRAPVLQFENAAQTIACERWLQERNAFDLLRNTFNATSRFARLTKITTAKHGRLLYIRFSASTGDAMGMNMISKGVEKCLEVIREKYSRMIIKSLSGNYCSDKKQTAINWIEGRGKSVTASTIIKAQVVCDVLKTNVDAMVQLSIDKNLIGSALAGGAPGSQNAHTANIVAAIFIATGQDAAQVVESSQCLVTMQKVDDGDLEVALRMPCLEVGTVGGGTILPAQRANLQLMGLAGGHPTTPGENGKKLAQIVASAVLAGELSLLAALSSGDLVKAHMTQNRSSLNLVASNSIMKAQMVQASNKRLYCNDLRSCNQNIL